MESEPSFQLPHPRFACAFELLFFVHEATVPLLQEVTPETFSRQHHFSAG